MLLKGLAWSIFIVGGIFSLLPWVLAVDAGSNSSNGLLADLGFIGGLIVFLVSALLTLLSGLLVLAAAELIHVILSIEASSSRTSEILKKLLISAKKKGASSIEQS